MRCHHSEDDLALYVEGDLGEPRHRQVETHLEECGACRTLVAELRESQAVFKSLRGEMVSAAALGDVRNRVLAEMAASRGRFPWGRWLYAVAGLACVVVVVIVARLEWRRANIPPKPVLETRETTKDPPKRSAELTSPARRPTGRRATPPLRGGESARPKQQVIMKLLTDDPDIVIYWLIDENGG